MNKILLPNLGLLDIAWFKYLKLNLYSKYIDFKYNISFKFSNIFLKNNLIYN